MPRERGQLRIMKNWIHAKWQLITDTEYKILQKTVWICSFCAENGTAEGTYELKLLKKYVDDIVCNNKRNALGNANSLPKIRDFILETTKGNGNPTFLDLNIIVNGYGEIYCHWYQKSTDTSTIFFFCCFEPLKYNKIVIQVYVHRIFNAINDL